ncbi:MocR-like pyridoxine biosynthesis transcription factor PdxR [Anaeromyxobacter terrae]|uniref:MocR-like pyridoxine biosynthesis transcription factor PdxR n=1 Tax=Anaeromyxobacter terrae TaxID=2925406 RepID=UPI001F59D51B|nr:PLP-dependent aminotransferase family protein [Anaeromyxobacter sp. SG22]
MRTWDLALPVDRDDAAPVVAQLAQAISSHIAAGRLRPGERLPGSRDLSRIVRVHRNTVVAAYAELAAEGWVDTSPSRGTFVSREIPAALRSRAAARGAHAVRAPGYPIEPGPAPRARLPRSPGALVLGGGVPDLRLVPIAALARAYRRALRRPAILDYGEPAGEERLRAAIGAMLGSTRGLDPDPARLLVTRGSQLALTLAARALVRPGDVVAVEALGYRSAWEAFRAAGARLVPVPVDESGLRVDALEALTRREKIRALHLTPHHQYPTTATLPAGRRLALLRLAAAERIAIVEDDYDGDFHYDGRPVLPLASNDPAGVVIYVGTFSKVLAPALRVGYVHAPAEVVSRLAEHRRYVDGQGDRVMELALAELLEDGEVQQHVWRMRRAYAARRDALAAELRETFGDALRFEVPAGGMALWCLTAPDVDVDRWAAAACERGVVFEPGSEFAFDGAPRAALRVGFARLAEQELREGVRRMAAALPAALAGARSGRPASRPTARPRRT